jgi:ribonuclease P protein component
MWYSPTKSGCSRIENRMIPSERRIKTKDFNRVKEKGRLYQTNDFGVCILKREDKKVSRFGFVISAKISKLAVHRNRINRSLIEAVRQNLDLVPNGFDIIFLVKKGIANKTTNEIMKQVELFLKEKKYLKSKLRS